MAVFARVGSFTKSQATGSFSQTERHNLGVTPKAMILWMSGATSAGFRTDKANPTFGFVDSTRAAYSASMGIVGGGGAADSGKRIGTAALYISAHGNQLITEADITAWDDRDFTITWTAGAEDTNQSGTYVVGYLILGGDIQSKVLTRETVAATGTLAVTGAGFQPTMAFVAQAGGLGTMDSGSNFGQINLGAMDGTSQWVLGQEAQDNNATTNEYSWQRTDRVIASTSANAYNSLASFSSFDADGVTVNYDDAPSAGWELIYLVLEGVTLKVGAFNKSTSPTNSQDVTTTGVNPAAIMFASSQRTTATTITDHGRFAIGFSDGVREVSGGITSEDNTTADARAYMSTTKAFTKVNNDTSTVDAEGDFTGGTGEFSMDWSTNDAVATEIFYVAIQATIPTGGPGGGGGGGGSGGKGGGGGQGGGGNGGGGGPPGGGPPGQTRRTIIGQQRRQRRGLIGLGF